MVIGFRIIWWWFSLGSTMQRLTLFVIIIGLPWWLSTETVPNHLLGFSNAELSWIHSSLLFKLFHLDQVKEQQSLYIPTLALLSKLTILSHCFSNVFYFYSAQETQHLATFWSLASSSIIQLWNTKHSHFFLIPQPHIFPNSHCHKHALLPF